MGSPNNDPVMSAGPRRDAEDERVAEQEFLAASVAVWREIDRLSAQPGGYPGLDASTELRHREREAHFFHQDDGPDTEGPDDQDFYDMRSPYGRPCDVCGEAGPCGYDTEGRPMIHTEEEANPDG